MGVALNIVIMVACCVALGKGASWLVDSAARIAKRIGVSELVIGLTVVAFGTSAPEFAVTVGAALKGHESIALANVVGSNIFNIGFIMGGCALVATIKTKATVVWHDGMVLLAITGVLLAMLVDNELSRGEGATLFLLLLGYLGYLFWRREAVAEDGASTGSASWRDVPMLLLGLGLVVAGGHFLVESGMALARSFGLSEWVIGVTVVAAGTSVPEFVISLTALLKKQHGISVGNLIGSNIFNTLGVLGLAGAIHPLAADGAAVINMAMLVGLTGLVIFFMRTGWRLSRREGVVLVLVSLAMWIYICGWQN